MGRCAGSWPACACRSTPCDSVRRMTSRTRCAVPPGPSPCDAPSQRQTKRSRCTPCASAAASNQRLQRSNRSSCASGSVGHDLRFAGRACTHGAVAREPVVRARGAGDRVRDERVLGLRQHQLHGHAAREAGLGEQQVTAVRTLGDGEIGRAGSEAIECGADRRRSRLDPVGREPRRHAPGVVDAMPREQQHLARRRARHARPRPRTTAPAPRAAAPHRPAASRPT